MSAVRTAGCISVSAAGLMTLSRFSGGPTDVYAFLAFLIVGVFLVLGGLMTDNMVERCVSAWKQRYGELAWGQDEHGPWLRVDGLIVRYPSAEEALAERDRLAMRAAIAALRDPSVGMMMAGDKADDDEGRGFAEGHAAFIVHWRAGIDEAMRD